MTTVVVTQPMLFPWPGFFEQLCLADVYIYLDDVQFSKGSFINRVQIEDGNQMRWLTIPLQGRGSYKLIGELEAQDDGWRQRHREVLARATADAPSSGAVLELMDRAYRETAVVETLIAGTELIATHLGAGGDRRIHRSSRMGVAGRSWERVLGLVQAVGGTEYVTGHGAARYLDHAAFEAAGVTVSYMDYGLAGWPCRDRVATPYQSILGLIAWTGARALDHLRPSTIPWWDFTARQAPR